MGTAYDFSPLYRSMISVDRVAELIDSVMRSEGDRSYPPYDVEKTGDDGYRITLAAAGFGADEFEMAAQANRLVVVGRKAKADHSASTYLHRAIASRDFERRFELADYVVVRSASCDNGVLAIDLPRQAPEALKPRRIEILAPPAWPNMRQINKDQTERPAA